MSIISTGFYPILMDFARRAPKSREWESVDGFCHFSGHFTRRTLPSLLQWPIPLQSVLTSRKRSSMSLRRRAENSLRTGFHVQHLSGIIHTQVLQWQGTRRDEEFIIGNSTQCILPPLFWFFFRCTLHWPCENVLLEYFNLSARSS